MPASCSMGAREAGSSVQTTWPGSSPPASRAAWPAGSFTAAVLGPAHASKNRHACPPLGPAFRLSRRQHAGLVTAEREDPLRAAARLGQVGYPGFLPPHRLRLQAACRRIKSSRYLITKRPHCSRRQARASAELRPGHLPPARGADSALTRCPCRGAGRTLQVIRCPSGCLRLARLALSLQTSHWTHSRKLSCASKVLCRRSSAGAASG